MSHQLYPSDLTDREWKCIKGLLPPAMPGGRPRTTDMRLVLNAIFYLNRTGSAWRYHGKRASSAGKTEELH